MPSTRTSFTNTGALGFNGETGNRTLELTGSGTGSLTSVLGNNSGSTSLIKSGTGTWTLRGNNTYSGTTAINAGTLIAANAGALGSSSANINVSAGGALGLSGGITTTSGGLSLIGDGVNSSGALYNVSGSNRFSGTINLKGDTTIGADAGTLTLSNAINLDSAVAANTTLSFNPNAGSTIEVTGTIADNNNDSFWLNVANTGNGTLRLSNSGNTYAGDTIIGTAGGSTTGTIQLGTSDALPLPPYYIEVPNIRVYSGTLDLNNNSATALGNLMIGGGATSSTATVKSGTGVLTLTKNLIHTAGGTATISANLELTSGSHEFRIEDSTNAADLTISGTISGAGVLNKTSAGTLVLSGANTYTGTTILNAGRVVVQNNTALGATGESYYTSVSSGAAIQLDGSQANLSVGERFTIAGSGILGTGAIQNSAGSNTLTSGITVTTQNTRIQSEAGSSLTITGGINAMTGGSLQVAGAGNTSISGDIAQSVGGLDKQGTGTLTLSGGNVFTGPVNVREGTLSVRSDSALGDNTNVVSVKSGATLAFETGAAGNILMTRGSGVTLEGGTIRSVTGANLYNPSVNLTSASTIVANTGASFAIGANLTASNSSATVRIGESTQSGNVTVSCTISTNGAALEKYGGGKLTLAQGGSVGALAVSGGSLALNSGTLSASSLSLAGGTSLLIAGGGTINVSGAATIAGGTLSSSINGYLSIRGNTTVTFTGSNTATGLTLKVGGTSSGTMAGAIRVNLGDALTIGTLEITGDTILDFGNSATTVLTSNNLIISNANAKIQVINWVGTSTSTSDIWYALSTIGTTTTNGRPLGSTNDTSAPLPQIEFYQPVGNTGSTTTWVADSGNWHGHEIRPTPEPATYGALLVSGCLGLFGWRRWRRNKAQSKA
jgi:autotransporter-associated beta strand protein